MKATLSRKQKQEETWPRKVQPGRAVVMVYRRLTPSGNIGFRVVNYADGDTRRMDSYASEADALAAAETLAKRIDSRDYVAASMTREQAIEFANSAQILKPFDVSVSAACSTVAGCLKLVGDLSNVSAAVRYWAARNKQVTKKTVADVVTEFLAIKKGRGASARYMGDLKGRLDRFADDCKRDACKVTTADVQAWLDGLNLSPQSYRNYRTVLHTLFAFAVARGYAADNPVEGVEQVKVRGGDVQIYSPVEIARLLAAATPDYLPSLAIGAFAGLRSAEIERLEWTDVDLAGRHIVISAGKAKTASRRIVPIHDNLAEWLRNYADKAGNVWPGSSDEFYHAQQNAAAATEMKADETKGIKVVPAVAWKQNGLRHSYASYRFAQTGDAGRVAGECGNSAAVIHRHYRELVKPADAERWFSVKPERPANVVPMPAKANSEA